MLQRNLTKGKMVEWVVLLVALVALGLSIAAVAKPCKSDFADTCKTVPPASPGGYDSCEAQKEGKPCDPNDEFSCGYSHFCKCGDGGGGGPGPPSSNCTIGSGRGQACKDQGCSNCDIPPCTIDLQDTEQYPFGRCADPNEIRAQENQDCYTPGCFNCDPDAPLCDKNLVCRRSDGIPDSNSVCQKCTPKDRACQGKSFKDGDDATSCCSLHDPNAPLPAGKDCKNNICQPSK